MLNRRLRTDIDISLKVLVSGIALWLLSACLASQPSAGITVGTPDSASTTQAKLTATPLIAAVTGVQVSGEPQAYQFSVEVASPDQGCDQYADWWEVLLPDGTLIYRRILDHSHVDEQPFVRSGGPVSIGPDTSVVVRAHMHPGGYGGQALQGSVTSGFVATPLEPDFASEVERAAPQPASCAF